MQWSMCCFECIQLSYQETMFVIVYLLPAGHLVIAVLLIYTFFPGLGAGGNWRSEWAGLLRVLTVRHCVSSLLLALKLLRLSVRHPAGNAKNYRFSITYQNRRVFQGDWSGISGLDEIVLSFILSMTNLDFTRIRRCRAAGIEQNWNCV